MTPPTVPFDASTAEWLAGEFTGYLPDIDVEVSSDLLTAAATQLRAAVTMAKDLEFYREQSPRWERQRDEARAECERLRAENLRLIASAVAKEKGR